MASKDHLDQERYPRHEFYIEDQVIISGSAESVQAALAELDDVEVVPVRLLPFSELGEPVTRCAEITPDLVIGLYKLKGRAPDVRKAIRQIGAVQLSGKPGKSPRGEPNYLTGHPWSGEGSPWSGEGSPWSGEGSPWSAEGSPWSGEGSPQDAHGSQGKDQKVLQVARPEWFMDQWALRLIELDNPLAGPLPQAQQRVTGAGVRVAVFDTSPYFPDLPEGVHSLQVFQLAHSLAGQPLHVYHPTVRAQLKASGKPVPDQRNHGYFIAGLVRALAPACELHLIRVLQHDNRGDLFTLEEALFDFLKGVAANPPSKGAVANLSLGIRIPPREAKYELPEELTSLYLLIQAARCLGVVVVAAAGNETKGAADARPAEVPACWESVLGVAACNPQNQRSCFSNSGDIAAPGGDGRAAPDSTEKKTGGSACRPRNEDCVDGSSGWAVIGPALAPVSGEPGCYETRYVFWSGSSFAAPLVSGLAALVMDAGGQMPCHAVEEAIKGSAMQTADPALGAGVINVRAALARFVQQ